ncbi:SIT4-associating protein SAP185 [Talaromyces islandicus]|uniref:SIT4-associating protein SAP185 n=1 Tax=Talaromyces islandicus TaxID=28573 RepID=A0A0U1LNH1_TALIS|nr:SIT4-associating protein SAP185 [Talaromyces islandicus]
MFWRFGGYATISTVDTLLDKPDVSLEELLDEAELISELKQHNTKLIEYLREDHILKRLMEYVVAPPLVNEDDEDDDAADKPDTAASKQGDEEPSEEKEKHDLLDPEDLDRAEKQRSKFAYIACEILSSETWSILESIMINEAYLRDFWDFMKRPAPLDSLQAGYFTKVNEVLFDKKTEEMLEFFKSLPGIVPCILRHVDNPMTMDLLLKIISLEKVEGGQGIVDWLKDQDLIPTLLSFISSDYPTSVQTSAGDFLKAIITISANATQSEQPCIGPNSLTRQLVSAQCVEQLIGLMLQGGNSLTVGVGIVIEVIRKNNSDYDPETAGGPDAPPSIYDPIYLGTLLRLFSTHIPDFMALIVSSKHSKIVDGQATMVDRGQLKASWGNNIEPLGFDRFKTCELMAELLHCSNMGLLNEIGSEEYIRQRDAEREMLVKQGAFDMNGDHESDADYNENTGDFGQDSTTESQSKALNAANTGDDDGFEDVSSSGVLVEGTDAAARNTNAAAQQSEEQSQPPGLHIEDSIVEETLNDLSGSSKIETSTPVEPSVGPLSPTETDVTEKVGEISLGNQSSAVNIPTGATSQQSPPVLSPHSEDTPAPLFAPSQEGQDVQPAPETTSTGTPAGTETPAIAESTPIEDEYAPQIQYDAPGQPVVGDFLKIQFVEHKVVPTILGFFFRFPWNNFLHNVVYDVVQQVFNGPMDRGFNRSLAIDLFDTGSITERIVEGQRCSDESQATRNMRLGYMGHLTLIAEEVVKFTERHPPEVLSQTVMDRVLHNDWIEYVERTLSETRERDNAILGGVRPDIMGHRQAVMNAVGTAQGLTGSNALANAGLNGGGGNGYSFENFDSMTHGSASSGAFGLGGSSSLLSGFGSSSDDEDEDMEDQDDEDLKDTTDSTAGSGSENVSSSSSQPIPILAPPPAPLNIVPSRARRQLAARLALHKQQAEAAQNEGSSGANDAHANDEQWQSNPFVIAGLEDDNTTSPGTVATEFTAVGNDDSPPSPTFHTGFTPPRSPSTNSSDEAAEELNETVRRKVRVPLEVDDDDDEYGEFRSAEMRDSDEEEEAIINESLGYSSFFGPSRYGGYNRSYGRDGFDNDEGNDSSDGEDGLVEILVPGRKSTSSN